MPTIETDNITNLRHVRELLTTQRLEIVRRKRISEADRNTCLDQNLFYIQAVDAGIKALEETKQHD